MKKRNLLKIIGPGLLFASTAIGTSHVVISTRAGAHHGMIFFWIIIAALFLKYPFFQIGTRYAIATGSSLIKGYKKQGNWAVFLFLVVIFFNMFAVTGAIGAVSAGLLKTILGIGWSMPIFVGLVIAFTVGLLFVGGYSTLDKFIKILSVILLVTVSIAFFAVLINGAVEPEANFQAPELIEGAGLVLLVSLIGWMPAGMEASTMNSIWVVEKMRVNNYKPSLKESLFDFNLGYVFTIILALMFLTIGAFTVFGSGQLFPNGAVPFINKLFSVFTQTLGLKSYWVIAIAAFGTIYGTLITILDAYTRSFTRGLLALRAKTSTFKEKQSTLDNYYKLVLPIIGLGGFALFYFSATSMVKILEYATILGFVTAPIIAFLNLRAIKNPNVPEAYRPSSKLMVLTYIGLVAITLFTIYYLYTLVS
ncbi:NRAMP family divalent metal transporter [Hyunsoonleella sp. 2307UL5-6]|uniref:NRAMP family divalent metal transporter n=1 Tax=Hyunsoonleella sp. 2307UL5-6 TaxID=3384768 RepID=UPI0039BCE394